eukprot:XP_001702284.1 predicted protein [Chlamydomonas reinhardtii]
MLLQSAACVTPLLLALAVLLARGEDEIAFELCAARGLLGVLRVISPDVPFAQQLVSGAKAFTRDARLPDIQEVLAVFDGAVSAIPLMGQMMQLYYRRDLLDAAGVPVPDSWRELVQWRSTCDGLHMPLVAALAALVQSRGRHTGFWFEPESMRAVTDTVAWDAALHIARQLTALAPPVRDDPPSPDNPCFSMPDFRAGRCAMALALAGQFKSDSAASNPASRVRGRIGVAPLPGSEVVLDWPSNTLQPCDATRCPYATRHTILPSAAAAAPYAGTGGTSFFLNQHKAPAEKLATYGLVMRLVNDLSWDFVTAPGSEFGPTRSEHLDAANADRWLRHGYDPGDLDRFLSLASANVVLDYRGSVTRGDLLVIKDILNDVAARVADVSVPLGEAAALGRARFAAAFPPEELAAIAASYRASIRGRRLRGSLAPGVGGETSLVLTDVVDSARAEDAVMFCMSAQEELAALAWPPELLKDDLCRPLASPLPQPRAPEPLGLPTAGGVHHAIIGNGDGEPSLRAAAQLSGGVGSPAATVTQSGTPSQHAALAATPLSPDAAAGGLAGRASDEDGGGGCGGTDTDCTATAAGGRGRGRDKSWLALRGLRVRMAVHSGVFAATDVAVNAASGRTTYGGVPMLKLRAAAGACPGALTLVTAATHALLAAKAVSSGLPYVVLKSKAPLEVFAAATPVLAPRWALLAAPGPADVTRTVAPGVWEAPVGRLCVSVVSVSGGAAIAAWNLGIWRESTMLVWRQAARLARANGGFLATTRVGVGAGVGAGLLLGRGSSVLLAAAFPCAAAGLRWSAELIAFGLLADWPASLLLHELAEETALSTASPASCCPEARGTYSA